MKKLVLLLMAAAFVWLAIPGTASAECGVCGDLTGEGEVDISDLTALIIWYYNWPPIPPECPYCADVNCDKTINVGQYPGTDLQYLIDYLFNQGPPPCDMDDDGDPNCDPC